MNGEIVITQRERTVTHTKLSERPKKGYALPLPPRKTEDAYTEDSENLKKPPKPPLKRK